MSIQSINLGTAPTGVGGDTPRSAFTKAAENFIELYAALGAAGSPLTIPAALPLAKGGTGVTTIAGLLTALLNAGAYGRGNAVRTVSQSGGAPTGGVMERGANSNGDYIRFADGTQICWKAFNTNSTGTYPVGAALFGSDAAGSGSFPVPFASTPIVTATAAGSAATTLSLASSFNSPTQGSWGAWRALSAENTNRTATIYLMAIGRWF